MFGIRLLIGLAIAAFSLISYFSSSTYNPVTGEKQRIKLSKEQEVAMGMQSAPGMAREFGGPLQDARVQGLMAQVGAKLVRTPLAQKSQYPFKFTALADPRTVNAFALPGGPLFITAALLSRLETEGQLAGVMGHEVGHVLARHSAEHMAKESMIQGMAGAAVIAGIDPTGGQAAMSAAQFINLKYGREDENEADALGVELMTEAGYDPRALIKVMQILQQATGGSRQPEFMSSHPAPADRAQRIQAIIQKKFPQGVPSNLIP